MEFTAYFVPFAQLNNAIRARKRQEHHFGELMFVDWAGVTIAVDDRHSGVAWQASLLVAPFGASSYT